MVWWLKIAAKLVLSRLPAGYGFWKKLGLFRHGAMDSAEYSYRVAEKHLSRIAGKRSSSGLVVLEMGPGDSVSSGLVARAHGAVTTYLVDSGPFASRDMKVYRSFIEYMKAQRGSFGLPDIDAMGFDEMMTACGGVYLTEGLKSLRAIPSGSVELVWSQAVLEHLWREEFQATMCELRRILKPDGIASHRVDLKDHLGGALNNLRFSSSLWEAPFFRRSGFYTNRIRFSEMLEHFARAGFEVELLNVERWSSLPTPRSCLHPDFRHLSDDELLVRDFDVLLHPVG
jgi:SAM-dependent methyltransferase